MEFLIHQARICPIFLSSDTSPPQNLPHQVTNKEGKICQIAWFARKDTFCNLFFRLAPSAQKGLSATEQNTLVCVAIFVNISSHKILLGPCLISFSTDFYGDGGRSDCCVEHDSILGEKLSVSENQYCFKFLSFVWQRLSCLSTFTLTVIDFAHCSPPLFPLSPLKRFLVATPSLSLPTTPTTSSTSPKPRF